MRISIELNGNKYAIDVENTSYIPIKLSTNQDAKSANFGKETEQQLGYFTKLPNAALRLCREEISQSSDIITLQQYAIRIEAINKQLTNQLELINC